MTVTPEERLEIERACNQRILSSIAAGDFEIHGLKWDTIISGIHEMRRLAPGNLEQRVEEIMRLKAAEARVAELEAEVRAHVGGWQRMLDEEYLSREAMYAYRDSGRAALKGTDLDDR